MTAPRPSIEADAAAGASAAPGMPRLGATLREGGAAFRVWAPHATAVFVTGDFNDWSEDATPMAAGEGGVWHADVDGAGEGHEYRYRIEGPDGVLSRIDPYARAVTNSVGNGIVTAAPFDWGDDAFEMPAWTELVIYEMHLGTFHRPDADGVGGFADAVEKFGHLKRLGINAIQVMPAAEFAGDLSWGYNPAHVFAVESAYGGLAAFKAFVRAAHRHGFAVILDVVYNHFGPSDLDLWRFDGWGEGEGGGIYFYQDHRAATPWGETRPDYGRPEVRRFIRDNALYWLGEFRVDGLRFDMTLYIRQIAGDEGDPSDALPDGWSLMQEINDEVATRFPGRITIAEDLRDLAAMTAPTGEGGAGFGAQWDARFVHPVREALIAAEDDHRSMDAVIAALMADDGGDPFRRVVYTESHDEVANGKARVPAEIGGEDAQTRWAAQKRSTLGAALVTTVAGIPMMFQGQEFLEGGWFDDSVPLDWEKAETFRGILRLWRDLIALRRGAEGLRARETEIVHHDKDAKTLAYLRGTGAGAVLVVVNLRAGPVDALRIGLPDGGGWRLAVDTDWQGYGREFGGGAAGDLCPAEGAHHGRPFHAETAIGGYSALIFTRADG
jgi:1,4-alpha-glucan branching enzyme